MEAMQMSRTLAGVIEAFLGPDLPVAIIDWEGNRIGPTDSSAAVVIRSPHAVARLVRNPGELGFARAYVAGEIDIEGDVFSALSLRDRAPRVQLGTKEWITLARFMGRNGLRALPVPPEEARLRGRTHSRGRDAEAVSFHYDISNRFYELVLGPSMTYSCALWGDGDSDLEAAQAAKYELICRKLALQPGMRLLDVGCGWGGMILHAVTHHGVSAVGVTLSRQQQEYAMKRISDAGLVGQADVRYQDYRDVQDGPFDAISSIGMFEHVGRDQLKVYFSELARLLAPGGRLLNHGIGRPAGPRSRLRRAGFLDRYVFPDGELQEIGSTITALQECGFEARHMETLREHYALTLRAWVANLERHWEQAVAEVGMGRARVWRLYMAGSALNFEANDTQVHQVLAVRPQDGRSAMPLRPDW